MIEQTKPPVKMDNLEVPSVPLPENTQQQDALAINNGASSCFAAAVKS